MASVLQASRGSRPPGETERSEKVPLLVLHVINLCKFTHDHAEQRRNKEQQQQTSRNHGGRWFPRRICLAVKDARRLFEPSPPPAEELIIMSLRRRQARAGDKVEVVKEGGDTGTLISGQGEV